MNYADIGILSKIENVRASPLNLLAGLTPTITVFTVNPSSPEKATNADPTDPSGVGTKQPTGVDYIGYMEYDLGSAKYVQVSGLSKMWAATAIALYLNMQYKLNSGDTYVEYPQPLITVGAAAATEPTNPTPFQFAPKIWTRYIRFGFKAAGSSTGNASLKPYEFAAHELKLAATG